MVDKYTKQVLDFLRNTSKENKEAEWDRISNLGLPNIGAFTFVEDAMFDIITRISKTVSILLMMVIVLRMIVTMN